MFDVGEEREVMESKIQKCIDSAKDITLQLTNVEFVDGKEWNSWRANNSLDASGGSASRNLLGAAKGALTRAAASTQTFDAFDW